MPAQPAIEVACLPPRRCNGILSQTQAALRAAAEEQSVAAPEGIRRDPREGAQVRLREPSPPSRAAPGRRRRHLGLRQCREDRRRRSRPRKPTCRTLPAPRPRTSRPPPSEGCRAADRNDDLLRNMSPAALTQPGFFAPRRGNQAPRVVADRKPARRSAFCTLPRAVLGNWLANTTRRGCLKRARRPSNRARHAWGIQGRSRPAHQ